jgi:hypothetical protein
MISIPRGCFAANRDLTLWSFLMASAHGAGLMVLPFVMPTAATVAAAADRQKASTVCTIGTQPVIPAV